MDLFQTFAVQIDRFFFQKPDQSRTLIKGNHAATDALLNLRVDGLRLLDYLLAAGVRNRYQPNLEDREADALDAIVSALESLNEAPGIRSGEHLLKFIFQRIEWRGLDGARAFRRLQAREAPFLQDQPLPVIPYTEELQPATDPQAHLDRMYDEHVLRCVLAEIERSLAGSPRTLEQYRALIRCLCADSPTDATDNVTSTLVTDQVLQIWDFVLVPEGRQRDDAGTLADCVQGQLGIGRRIYDGRNVHLRKEARNFLARQGPAVRDKCREERY